MNCAWQSDSCEHARQKIDLANLIEVIDGTGIGNYHLHNLEPKFFESLSLLFKIFHGVVLINSMRLQEAIQLDAR